MSDSSYLPPRARNPGWWREKRYGLWRELRSRIPEPVLDFGWRQLLFTLLLPGYGLFLVGRKQLGRLSVAVYLFLGLIALIGLGYVIASIAFGLMIALHVLSMVTGTQHFEPPGQARWRAYLNILLAVLLLNLGLYGPLQNMISRHLFLPLRAGQQVCIINCRTRMNALRPGDWVAYRIEELHGHGYIIRAGYGFSQVQALAGDAVQPEADSLIIRGRSIPRPGWMAPAARQGLLF